MSDLELLLQTITILHDACFDDSSWTPALTLVSQLLRSTNAVFAIESKDLTFPIVRSAGLSPEAAEAYATNFQSLDPVIAHARTAPTGIAYTDWMAIDPQAFDRTRFADEYAARFDMRHCVQAFTDRSASFSGFFAAARPNRGGAYSEEDRRLVHALLPHIRHVMQIRRHLQRVEGQQLAALDALDRLEHGAFLVDADLRVTFANREAEDLIASGRGLAVIDRSLAAANPLDTVRLQRLVRSTISRQLDPDPQPLMIKRRFSRPLLIRVIPLSARIVEGMFKARTSAFILVADPDRHVGGVKLDLGPIFNFTSTETKVAWLLADGLNTAAIAARMDVSIATVRTHLAHIFGKTGSRRQAEVVALLQQLRRF